MIKFMTLFADDLEATADVYRALGLSFDGETHGDGPYHLAHDRDGLVVEIYKRKDAHCDGMMLGFEVADLSETKTKLRNTGARMIKDVAIVDGTERMIVEDPEGRQIYIQKATSGNTV